MEDLRWEHDGYNDYTSGAPCERSSHFPIIDLAVIFSQCRSLEENHFTILTARLTSYKIPSMGRTFSCIAIRKEFAFQALSTLGIEPTDKVIRAIPRESYALTEKNGWQFIFFGGDGSLTNERMLRKIGAAETLIWNMVETVNFNSATYFNNGQKDWEIQHDGDHGPHNLKVHGILQTEIDEMTRHAFEDYFELPNLMVQKKLAIDLDSIDELLLARISKKSPLHTYEWLGWIALLSSLLPVLSVFILRPFIQGWANAVAIILWICSLFVAKRLSPYCGKSFWLYLLGWTISIVGLMCFVFIPLRDYLISLLARIF